MMTFSRGFRSALVALPIVAFCIAAYALFGRLFLLIEYRQWADPRNLPVLQKIFTLPGIVFSRSFGMFCDAIVASLFGTNAVMHDAVQIAMPAATAAFLALALAALLPTRAAVWRIAGCIAFFLFSTPVVDALSWQATMLDKLCVLLTSIAVYLAARISPERLTPASIVGANVLFLAIAIAAYNSKESSYALVPSIVVLLAIRFRSLPRALMLTAAALVFACIQVGIVAHDRIADASSHSHALSGEFTFNVFHFVVYLFNATPYAQFFGAWPSTAPAVQTGLVVLLAAVIAIGGYCIVRFADRRTALLTLWALGSSIASYAIYVQARGIAAYYMVVTEFYLAIAIYLLGAILAERVSLRTARVTGGLLLVLYLLGYLGTLPPYRTIARESANFDAALAQLHPGERVTFVYPASMNRAYMFLQSGMPEGLAPLVHEKLEQPYTGPVPHPAAQRGRTIVVFGDEFQTPRFIR